MSGKTGSDRLSRRDFFQVGLGGTIAAGAFLSRYPGQRSVVRGACPHDCPDTCAWLVTRKNGKLAKIEADTMHPFTRGALCSKMDHYLEDIVYNPERLLYPLRRVGPKGEGRFERVSWDQALDDVASRLKRILREDGPSAILPYSDAGTQGVVQSESLDRRFFARLGATRLERNICGSAGSEGVTATMGTTMGILPEDIVRSRLVLIWASNPVLTNPHGWAFIEEARRRGARIVTIDPQRSATAARSDWHVQPIPGTDAALALGMMHVIVKEGLHDADYVERYTLGFDRLRKRLAEYPPERVAGITGLEKEEIVKLARAYAGTRPSTIRLLVGMEHRASGAMSFRTVACLPALVGAWRERGGGLLYMTYSLFELNGEAVTMPKLEDPKTRSVNMVQLGRALTEEGLKPTVRALIVYNSNPATIAPNQNLVRRGLAREDLLTVVLEQFLTDTARYADYVFPAATQVETLDLMTSWGQRYLALNLPAAAPAGEAVPNTEFFRRLASRLDLKEPYLQDSDEEIVRAALKSSHPYLKGITFERLQKEGWAPLSLPEPWLPYAQGKFPTPSGRCEFYNERLIPEGLDPLPGYVPPREKADARHPLMLLTSKASPHFLNSSHVGVKRSAQAEGEPRLRMNPADAAARGIADGDMVRVFNDRGSMLVRVRLVDPSLVGSMRAGVVAMSHGWWASRMPGASSPNALTPDGLSDLGGGGDFHDARVQVARAG
ncbi:MAG: molybdopterin-containing oxidoreductase family protein [Acidobacteriota bacterium]